MKIVFKSLEVWNQIKVIDKTEQKTISQHCFSFDFDDII